MFKEMFQETDKRLQAAQATIADLQGQLKEMTESQKRCWNEWTLAEQNVESLQQRVAQLEGALETQRTATYQAVEREHAAKKQLTTLQADHAALLGLVRALPRVEGKVETKESEIDFSPYWGLTDGTYFIPETPLFETKGEAEAYITLLAYRASLPAQPAQGGVKCVWVDDEGGIYQTGCKHAFMVDPDSDEPPIWIKFCCYCGSLVEFFVPDAEGETRA